MSKKKFFFSAVCFLALFVLSASFITPAVAGRKSFSLEGKININNATAKEFALLAGIGKKTAENIINFRSENGSFKTPSEICNIKGVGKKTLEQNKEYITVEGETTLQKVKH